MARQKAYLLKHQCARTRTGSVRHLPLSDGRRTPGFNKLVNQAINYPIQGFAAHVTGSALVDCEQVLCEEVELSLVDYHTILLEKRWGVQPIPLAMNEVHDNLVFDLPWDVNSAATLRLASRLRTAMEEAKTLRALVPEFTLPLSVDMKLGVTWGTE